MKEELKFFRRLLAASLRDRDTRLQIYRSATILADGRWSATNGHSALILTPPASLAKWRSIRPLPLEPLIDGAQWGELPELTDDGLVFACGTVGYYTSTAVDIAKVIPADQPQAEIAVWPLLRQIDDAVAEVNAQRRMSVSKRHEIRNTPSKKRGTYCHPPQKVATIGKTAITRIWGNGSWRVYLDLAPGSVELGESLQACVSHGEPEGVSTGLNIALVRAAVGSDRGAVLGLRGEKGIMTVTLSNGVALIMPMRV